jgi:ABC-type amino acid transport substrate-binding protein
MQHLKMLLVALVASMITFYLLPHKGGVSTHTAPKETTYERVMRTGTIRCAWITRPPYVIIDMKTGEKSGISVDIMNEVAKQLSLKIDWVEEVGAAEFVTGLNQGRYDAMCMGGWMNSARARQIDSTKPLAFDTAHVFTRQNNLNALQLDVAALNQTNKKFVTLDGAATSNITHIHFPKAAITSLPETAPLTQQADDVNYNKADFAVLPYASVALYNQKNPQKPLKPLTKIGSLGSFPVVIFIDKNQHTFKNMLDNTIADLHALGFVEATIKKYNGPQNGILLVDQGYQTP